MIAKSFGVLSSMILLTIMAGCSQTDPITPRTFDDQTKIVIQETLIVFAEAYEIPPTLSSPTLHRGYGVRIDNQGYLLTAKHILPEKLSQLVLADTQGRRYILKQLRLHPTRDVALIQITPAISGVNFLQIASGTQLAPLGYFFSGQLVTFAKTEQIDNSYTLLSGRNASPGSSGSPVWNEHQQLIGLIAKQSPEGVQIVKRTPELTQRANDMISPK